MTAILQLLQSGEYDGNTEWVAVREWANERGEMGIYRCEAHRIGRENNLLIFQIDGKRVTNMHSVHLEKPDIEDMELIAKFADAKPIPPSTA